VLKFFSKAASSGPRARAPRNEIACSATLCAGNAFHRVQLKDVSKSGCKVTVPRQFPAGEKVQIALEAYHSLTGTVRWCREGLAGIQFARELNDASLERWRKALAQPRTTEVIEEPHHKRNFLGERMWEGPAE